MTCRSSDIIDPGHLPRTTKRYDRAGDEITLDEVERRQFNCALTVIHEVPTANMSKRFDRIAGTLINEQGVTWNVELDIVVAQLHNGAWLANETISEIKLAPGSTVPDGGPYTLQYIFNGTHEDRVRAKFGRLINA